MKLAIYPFDLETAPFVRYSSMLAEASLVYPVAPPSFGLEGKNAGACDGGTDVNFFVSSDIDSVLCKADSLLISSATQDHRVLKCRQVFDKALTHGMQIFLPKYLCNQKEFSGCDLSNNLIKLLEYENVKEEQFPESRLYKIPVPTIAVAGAGRFCGKFSVQLALRQMFVKSEYKLTQVGSQNYSRLFGFHSWPEFLFLNIPMAEKIIRLNHFIYDIVMKEKPEVLIFGIPGGIMPLNPFCFEEFGELAFVICNAVQIDLGIISLYAEEYTDAFLDEITKICKYKLNMPVGPIHVSSTCMHISQEQKKAEFFVSDYEYVMRILRMSVAKKYQLFSIFDRPSLEAAFEKVINSFSIG